MPKCRLHIRQAGLFASIFSVFASLVIYQTVEIPASANKTIANSQVGNRKPVSPNDREDVISLRREAAHSRISTHLANRSLPAQGGTGSTIIDTIAGGLLGDGSLATRAHMVSPVAAASDPLGRGLYVADITNAGNFISFINTTRNTASIGGRSISGGIVRVVVGGGFETGDGIPARTADAGYITGLATSNDGDLLFWTDASAPAIRVFNAGATSKQIGGVTLAPGNVTTLLRSVLSTSTNGLAVHPVTGEIYIADAALGVHRIFKTTLGGITSTVAGNGAATKAEDIFFPGAATSVPLLQPRAIVFDPQGNLYIADTGHARVIKVDAGGNASLVAQFAPKSDLSAKPYVNNPFTSGLAYYSGKLYLANGNTHDILRVDALGTYTRIAGTYQGGSITCDYQSGSPCGDGGPGTSASLNLIGSSELPPLAGIAANSRGIFILDQGAIRRGRVRYVNLSATATEVAYVSVGPGIIKTIAGTGLAIPFDGGQPIGATFFTPSGVGHDNNGNLWITDTLVNRLRFLNRGTSSITIFAGTAAEQVVPPLSIVTVNKDVGSGGTDGVPVNQAGFDTPQGLAITTQGIFIADTKKGATAIFRTSLVRFVNTTNQTVEFYSNGANKISIPAGNIATIAGGGTDPSNIGDGANPFGARLVGATDVAVHPASGDIYIADAASFGANASSPTPRIRRVNRQTGAVSTILTGGTSDAFVGLSFDSQGRLLVANAGRKTNSTTLGNSAILREKSSGLCAAAPMGCFDTILSGGSLKNPRDVVEGKDGALYVTNAGPSEFGKGDHKILRIVVTGSTGVASTFAGTDEGYSGDGGAATSAQLRLAADDFNVATVGTAVNVRANVSITVAPNGEIIFTDSKNNAIRRLSSYSSLAPTLTGLSPNSSAPGSGAFSLVLNGTNFVSGSVARWNGSERPTTFVSSGQLTAFIPAEDLALGSSASVTVFNSLTGGGTSNALTFAINSNCTYLLNSASQSFSASGGSGSVSVTAGSGCTWTANSNASWIAITSGASGSGNGAVAFSVALNTTTSSRTGTITIAGQTFTVTQSGSQPVTAISAASFSTLGGIAPESIAAGFGAGMTSNVVVSTTVPLPTVLDGTTVTIRDSIGTDRLAPLYFVAPTQINFQVPVGTAVGAGTIIVRGGNGSISTGSVQIGLVAPGLFSANSSGQGVAFGRALRIKGDGSQSYEDLAQSNQGTFTVRTINLGPPSDQVYLVLRGTGFRNRSSLSNVAVKIGGVDASVTYAGAASEPPFAVTPGVSEDQLNVLVPRSLAGRALVDIVLTVDGKTANTVQVSIGMATDAPAVVSISPARPTVSSSSQNITVNGTGFQSGLTVTLTSPGSVTTTLSGALLQSVTSTSFVMNAALNTVGVWALRVNNPDGGQSGVFNFSVDAQVNPVPVLSSISPSSMTAGGAGFTLTINGSNFTGGSVVLWQGSIRSAAFISSTQLTAQIPASDISAAGSAAVTVSNPAPGGGTSNALTFTINPSCSYSINPTGQSFVAAGGTGSVAVMAGSGCGWTATSNAAWISVTSGASGNGNGTVNYSVAVNSGAARSGTITIAGQTFTVTQGCTDTVISSPPASQAVCPASPVSFSVTATGAGTLSYQWRKNTISIPGATGSTFTIPSAVAGDAGAYSVVVTGACDSVTSSAVTLTINSAPSVTTQSVNQSVTVGGSATFTAAASGVPAASVQWQVSTDGVSFSNVSGATSTTLTLSNVTLAQNGNRYRAVFTNSCGTATSNPATLNVNCPAINLSPTTLRDGSTGAPYSETLTANGGVGTYRFSLSAGALPAGLSLSTAGVLSGTPTQSGTFNLTITAQDANNCPGVRAYTLLVACAFDISPKSQSFGASGGDGGASVLTGGGCSWTAVSNAAWITVTGGANGTGNGSVGYSVAANTGTSQRVGTMTIAGLTFTVTQAGVNSNPVPVISSLSPSSIAAGSAAFVLTVNGSNFVGGSVVRLNGNDRQTNFISASQLTAQIPATDLAAASSAQITVVNPAPGGGASNVSVLTITPVVSGFTLSGRITYSDVGRPVPGAVVTSSAPGTTPVSSPPSGSNGFYSISGLAVGNYIITPSKSGNVNGITAFDAARIMQRLAAGDPFAGIQRRAADVDGNDIINVGDALRIANYIVGAPDVGQVGKWTFDRESRIAGVIGNLTDQDFQAALIGDVTRTWLPDNSLAITTVAPLTLNLRTQATGEELKFPGVMINGVGFAPGLTLVVMFPEGGEMRLRESQILDIKPDSFTALAGLPGPGLWALRVINPDGRSSDVFVVRIEK
jgi:uncharacterized protein (TIGR03437 family)